MGRHWDNPYECLHHTDCGKKGYCHLYCDMWNPDRRSIFGYSFFLELLGYHKTNRNIVGVDLL